MSGQHEFLGSRQRYQLFTALKYLVYALLTFNVYLFLQEELGALEHTFTESLAPGQVIQVFSATIDTAAWVILLLLFELLLPVKCAWAFNSRARASPEVEVEEEGLPI